MHNIHKVILIIFPLFIAHPPSRLNGLSKHWLSWTDMKSLLFRCWATITDVTKQITWQGGDNECRVRDTGGYKRNSREENGVQQQELWKIFMETMRLKTERLTEVWKEFQEKGTPEQWCPPHLVHDLNTSPTHTSHHDSWQHHVKPRTWTRVSKSLRGTSACLLIANAGIETLAKWLRK